MIAEDGVDTAIEFLRTHMGYMKSSDSIIAARVDCSEGDARIAKAWIKRNMDEVVEQHDDSPVTKYIKEQGIASDKIKTVTYRQNSLGQTRFSVVTNDNKEDIININSIIDSIAEKIQVYKLENVISKNEKTLVIYLSDKHVGAYTKPTAMYNNDYDGFIFEDRMVRVFQRIEKAYLEHGAFEKIIITDLGDGLDGLDGNTTRGGHKLPQIMTSNEAFDIFVNVHKQFYTSLLLSSFASSYEIIHLTNDNHSGRFAYFANRALQEYMSISFPEVPFVIAEEFITPVYNKNFTLLLCHGKDDEDMKFGLPLDLDVKTSTYIMDYVIKKEIPVNNLHFIKGDLHQSSTNQGKHFRYRNVPSIYGSSKWIMTNHNYTTPGCSFDLFDGSEVVQWDLWLD